ncbi:NAD(P)/FAD-dependent oxidoreductase [Nocardia cyriacigeorgica]|uniref:NAD(P)/FAD-dependent oxidoreductase n=1 Tax=Nocardia cyriacigeorgica TaxID=135487 RepID=UPI0024537B33|nr:FAD-dependent oxidoreductase [Nocardia cyriacigeorgica]
MSSQVSRLVVVGASLAGLRAVEAARKSGYAGALTLIGAEEHLPYDRPPLSKAYLDTDLSPDVTLRDERYLREELEVDLLLGARAESLDTAAHQVVAGGRAIEYDSLVIATGSAPRMIPGVEGIDGIHALRTIDDARAVRAAWDGGARTLVVGAGFIGSEIASGARKRGLPVTIVEGAHVPLARAVGVQMGAALAGLHHRAGTDLRCGVTVERFETDEHNHIHRVHLSDGTVIDADLVVVGIGAVPATDWLTGSGLDLHNGVRCDATLAAVGAKSVYAAGDVARWENTLFDEVMRVEHWSAAAEQGAVAARHALAPDTAKPFETVPYFWSDWYEHRIQFAGVADADEISVVSGSPDGNAFTALYRRGDRVGAVLTLNGQAVVMKYRALIARGASWDEALAFRPGRPRS